MTKPADSLIQTIQKMERELQELRQYRHDATAFLRVLWTDVDAIIEDRLVEDTSSWFYSEDSWADYRNSIQDLLEPEDIAFLQSLREKEEDDD